MKCCPIISVVTACRNAEATIGRTLRSVQRQVGVEGQVEQIVVDGASTDRTIEIVREFEPVRWISESDNGIAEAFNKGLDLVNGEYLLYLNADDYLADDRVLRDVVDFIETKERPAWIVGNVRVSRHPGEVRDQYPQGRLIPISCWSLLFRNRFCHQAVFLKKCVLVQCGGFDTSFQAMMDYELWHRLCRQGYRPVHMARVISVFSFGGISSSASSVYLKEKKAVADRFRDTSWKRLIGAVYDRWKG